VRGVHTGKRLAGKKSGLVAQKVSGIRTPFMRMKLARPKHGNETG
tara:strand:- start:1051 stop:1185 length:135 start_codon:yes stop_codon:yes gene_type:complete